MSEVKRFTRIVTDAAGGSAFRRPIGHERARGGHTRQLVSYALRGCSRALLARSRFALSMGSLGVAGGHRWLLTAVRGISGARPEPVAPSLVRR